MSRHKTELGLKPRQGPSFNAVQTRPPRASHGNLVSAWHGGIRRTASLTSAAIATIRSPPPRASHHDSRHHSRSLAPDHGRSTRALARLGIEPSRCPFAGLGGARWELNPRHTGYAPVALPLSYSSQPTFRYRCGTRLRHRRLRRPVVSQPSPSSARARTFLVDRALRDCAGVYQKKKPRRRISGAVRSLQESTHHLGGRSPSVPFNRLTGAAYPPTCARPNGTHASAFAPAWARVVIDLRFINSLQQRGTPPRGSGNMPSDRERKQVKNLRISRPFVGARLVSPIPPLPSSI